MHTQLSPALANRADAQDAQALLRNCVHCGFCTATCPTYQLLGDELDGPRGRIYLIKQVLEGAEPTRKTQTHLDRCLSCRNCETTCPSGVEYGHLLEIGRKIVDEQVPRPAAETAMRWALKKGLNSPAFGPAMAMGQALRPVLPASLQAKVPPKQAAGAWPQPLPGAPTVLLLRGCVQPAMAPNTNAATARVLHALGFNAQEVAQAQCCGAINAHLGDEPAALPQMRANIDAWWPLLSSGQAQALVMTASGCGAMVKDYAHALRHDPAYAEKAALVVSKTQDLSEFVAPRAAQLAAQLKIASRPSVVFHPPCTLQHGQQLRGGVEQILRDAGFAVRLAERNSHLCCGSAGTYSVLQPELAKQLRDNKLAALNPQPTDVIASANIGCITHLQSASPVPVRHWVELLDEAL